MRAERVDDLANRGLGVAFVEPGTADRHQQPRQLAVHVPMLGDRNQAGVPVIEDPRPVGLRLTLPSVRAGEADRCAHVVEHHGGHRHIVGKAGEFTELVRVAPRLEGEPPLGERAEPDTKRIAADPARIGPGVHSLVGVGRKNVAHATQAAAGDRMAIELRLERCRIVDDRMGDDPERRLVETIEPLGLTDRAERASGRPTGLDMHDPLHLMMTDISPEIRRQVRVHDVLGVADELDERGRGQRPADPFEHVRESAEQLHQRGDLPRRGSRIPEMDVRIDDALPGHAQRPYCRRVGQESGDARPRMRRALPARNGSHTWSRNGSSASSATMRSRLNAIGKYPPYRIFSAPRVFA